MIAALRILPIINKERKKHETRKKFLAKINRHYKEGEKIKVELLQDRAIVWNTASARKLYAEGYFGKPLGIRKPKGAEFDRPLELSLFETLYLAEKGKIDVLDSGSRRLIKIKELKNHSKKNHDLFLDKYIVYKDLREKSYVVRPGLKFGTHFAVYEKGPGIDHAPFMVSIKKSREKIGTFDIVRAGRLATTVRKQFVIASPDIKNGDVDYLIFKWFKA